jgi:hypothetical protein
MSDLQLPASALGWRARFAGRRMLAAEPQISARRATRLEDPLATLRRKWGEIPGGEQHTL